MIDWDAAQSDKFIGTAAAIASMIAAGVGSAASVYAAHKQSSTATDAAQIETNAQKYAADLQAKGSADALAFTKAQGENAYQNSEAARQGNYGMYAAAQRRLGSVGDLVGLGPREVPAYVPGVDPNFTGAPAASGAAPTGAPAAAPTTGGDAAKLKALLDGGMDPQHAVAQFNSQYGRVTGNQAVYYDPSQHGGVATIGLPDAYLAKPGSSWDITQRGGAPAAPALKSAASYLTAPPTPYAAVPMAPGLALPGSANSYLNG